MKERTIHPPLISPVGLEEVKQTLRLGTNEENPRLLALIKAATQWIENLTGKALIEQTREIIISPHLETQRRKSKTYEVLLPTLPLIEVLSISEGEKSLKDFEIKDGTSLVIRNLSQKRDLIIQYKVGYGSTPEEVPAPLQHATLIAVTSFYEKGVFPPKSEVNSLLQPYKSISIL